MRSIEAGGGYERLSSIAVDRETLDAAYAVYEEFGPDRRVPRRDKLHRIYPRLTAVEMDALMIEMAEISKTVWSIAHMNCCDCLCVFDRRQRSSPNEETKHICVS